MLLLKRESLRVSKVYLQDRKSTSPVHVTTFDLCAQLAENQIEHRIRRKVRLTRMDIQSLL